MPREEYLIAQLLLEKSEALHLGPPTSVEAVLDVLADEGLSLRFYDPSSAPGEIREVASRIDEVLVFQDASPVLFVNQDRPVTRMRFSLWHGVGHFCLPHHHGLNYIRQGCTTNHGSKRPYERQADRFAAAMNMPPAWFQSDMVDLPFGLKTVETLAERYVASVESAAIHYVNLSDNPCAAVSLRPQGTNGYRRGSPLAVRYGIRSASFRHSIRPGTPVALDDNLFWICSEKGLAVEGEIGGHVLGLKRDVRLQVECLPQGRYGDVLALVRPVERQLRWLGM